MALIAQFEDTREYDNQIKIVPATETTPEHFAADNGVYNASFHQTGNRIEYLSANGRKFIWTPFDMKYVDEFGLEDTIYNVQDVPLETKGNYARFNRTMPDVDDWFIVGNRELKHQILIQGFQRDPMEFLFGNIELVISGRVEYDQDVVVFANGELQSGYFETEEDIRFMDGEEVAFRLPKIVAFDSKFPEREIAFGKYRVSITAPGYMDFQIVMDNTWVSSLDRVYPIVIDPTLVTADSDLTYGLMGPNARHVVYDSAGTCYIGARIGANPAIYKSTNKGQTWTALPAITAAFSVQAFTLVIDNQDRLHVIMSDWSSPGTERYYLRHTYYNGSAWSAVTNITSIPTGDYQRDYYPHAYHRAGKIYISFASNKYGPVPLGGNYVPAFCMWDGTVWSAPKTWVTEGTNVNTIDTVIVVTKNGRIHVLSIYQNNSTPGWALYHSYSDDGGTTFTTALVRRVASATNMNHPTIAYDEGNDIIWVVFAGTPMSGTGLGVLYAKLQNGTWSVGDVVANLTGTSANSIRPKITLSGSLPHVIYSKTTATYTSDLSLVKYQNGAWGTPTQLSVEPGRQRYSHCAPEQDYDQTYVYIYQNPTDSSSGTESLPSLYSDTINTNVAPLAPSNLTRANFDATAVARLSWKHNDLNGNPQYQYQVQISKVSDGLIAYDSGVVTNTNELLDLAANTLQNGIQYQWRVMTWDKWGTASPWSTYATFKCGSLPVATVTSPTSGFVVNSNSITVTGSYSQAQNAPEQSYQFLLLDTAGRVVGDSGTLLGTANQSTFTNLKNNTSYQLQMVVTSQDGLSASSVAVPISVSYTPPVIPTVTVTNEPLSARVKVDFVNPAPGAGIPAAASNNVFRRKVGDTTWKLLQAGALSPYYDYTCPVGVYEYGVIAISDIGALSDYGAAQVTSSFSGEWLIDELNPEGNVQFLYNQTRTSIGVEQDRSYVKTFANYPLDRKSETFYHTGTLSAMYLKQDREIVSQIQAIEEMARSDRNYLLKLMSGLMFRVSLSKPSFETQYGNNILTGTVTWTEVADV